jgi:hypothetical protein
MAYKKVPPEVLYRWIVSNSVLLKVPNCIPDVL